MKPATPLPWEMDEEATICGSNSAIAVSCKRESAYMDEDAGYIVHSANAYPRLVLAMQQIVNNTNTIKIIEAVQRGRDLLSELGEPFYK